MSWKIVLALAVASIAIIGAGAAWAVLSLDSFGGVRNRIAEALLLRYAGETAQVAGPTTVILGSSTTISVEGVRRLDEDPAEDPSARPHGLRLSFPLREALRGRFRPTSLTVTGLRMTLGPAGDGGAPLGEQVARTVTRLLAHPLTKDITFENVVVSRPADPDGWIFELVIDRASGQEADDGIAFEFVGRLNGADLSASARAPHPDSENRSFEIRIDVPGLTALAHGRLDADPVAPSVDGSVTLTSDAIGDLLDTLLLSREIEGEARFSASVSGPLSGPALSQISMVGETAAGRALSASGAVADAFAGSGLDLTVVLTGLASADAARLAPRRVEGVLAGDLAAVEVADLIVETGLASVDLQRIGPVSVARARRDENGLVRMEGVRILQGDPAAPTLDLTGEVADLIGLSGIAASAAFNLDLAALAGLKGTLGGLRGTVALSDASGDLALTALQAQTPEGGPLRLSLARREDGTLGLRTYAPDLAALGRAVGIKTSGGELGFDGDVRLDAETLGVHGALSVGETKIDARLAFALETSRTTGALRSDLVHLDSARDARSAIRILDAVQPANIALEDDVAAAAVAALSVDAAKVASPAGGEVARDLSAKVHAAGGRLRVDDLTATVFGGRATGTLDARLDENPAPLQLDATATDVDLAELFAAFNAPVAASGPLHLDLSLATVAGDAATILSRLDGRLDAAIGSGRLADDLLNLAGESVLGWAATRSPDGSAPLECAVASVTFEQGSGKVDALVLETDLVQLAGQGTVNLRERTVNLILAPHPKRDLAIGEVGSIKVGGPLSAPSITLEKGAAAGKAVGDIMGTPLRLLQRIVPHDRDASNGPPCAAKAGWGRDQP